MGEMGGCHMNVVEELEGKRPLAKPRHGWGNNIEMICKKCDGETWTRHLVGARYRWRTLVNAVMNLRFP
jgi:hypothetical protein